MEEDTFIAIHALHDAFDFKKYGGGGDSSQEEHHPPEKKTDEDTLIAINALLHDDAFDQIGGESQEEEEHPPVAASKIVASFTNEDNDYTLRIAGGLHHLNDTPPSSLLSVKMAAIIAVALIMVVYPLIAAALVRSARKPSLETSSPPVQRRDQWTSLAGSAIWVKILVLLI